MSFSLSSRAASSPAAQCSRACQCARCMPSANFGFTRRAVRAQPRTVSVRAATAAEPKKDKLARLLANNKEWAADMVKTNPNFFNKLKDGQSPEYLWIGCADSRVPANQIVGLDPGEVFVQRNVGNQAHHSDMNCMSCIEFSVKALGVRTIIVCGHYKCGAVKAALTLPQKTSGLTNCWISDIREARNQHMKDLEGLTLEKQVEKLCEFNVLRQVFHVCTSPTVQEMWAQGEEIQVFGVCYSLDDGILKQLVGPITSNEKIEDQEQQDFVNQAMEKKEANLLESLLGMIGANASFKEEEAPKPKKPVDPLKANAAAVTSRLADHAAWDQGKY